MNETLKRLLAGVGGLLLIAFVCYQVFRGSFHKLETELAIQTTVNETIDADGYVIRNEQLVTSDKAGVMVYAVKNGTKVAAGSTLIEYYQSEADVETKKEIDRLTEQIDVLTELDTQNQIVMTDLDLIDTQISAGLYSLLSQAEGRALENLPQTKDKLLRVLNQNQLATKRVSNYSKEIAALKEELKTLSKRYKGSTDELKSVQTGYFVSEVDGFETALSYEDALTLTPEDLQNAKASSVPAGCVGKIISDHQWYIATVISEKDARTLWEGKDIQVNIPLSGVGEVEAKIEKINIDSKTQKATVLLSCEYMNSELSVIRNQPMQLIVARHTGLRVSSRAVRVKDSKTGVYVQVGNLLKFREIDIAFTGSGFVICNTKNGSGELKIYDDVVVKGKNLDERKFVN